MTYVVSSNNLDVSVTKTISLRKFCLVLGFVLFVAVGIGVAIGFGVSHVKKSNALEQVKNSEKEYQRKALVYQQTLVDHIGELSARIVNLELEAGSLAEKIGVVQEFEERMKIEKVTLERKSKVQPGAVGGPFIEQKRKNKQNNKPAANKNKVVPNTKTEQIPSEKLPEQADPEPILNPIANRDVSWLMPLKNNKSIIHKIDMAESFNQTDGISYLVAVENNIDLLKKELGNLEQYVSSVSVKHMYFPGRKPVANARISSRFGNRIDPIHAKMAFHSGIDFAAPVGTPVHASAGGKVIFAGSRNAYGNVVEIDHGAGVVTRYAHNSQVLVKQEQIVMPGDVIAKVGSTGRSTGSHLHFEILKDGRFVNPKTYLSRF